MGWRPQFSSITVEPPQLCGAITGRKEALDPGQLPSPLSTVGRGFSCLDSLEWDKDSSTGVREQRPTLAIVCSAPPYPIQYLPGFLSQLGIEA